MPVTERCPSLWLDRFFAKVDQTSSGCWRWTGCISTGGYGRFTVASYTTVYAHRLAYEYFVGPIPAGLVIDHLCRNRSCVNPKHLEPVVQRQNVLRGESPSAHQARQTHCIHEHELSLDNTYVTRAGRRMCRTCKRTRDLIRRRDRGIPESTYRFKPKPRCELCLSKVAA